jgi:hypothetical protein
MLLAVSEDDEGDVRPEFLEELPRRRREIADRGVERQGRLTACEQRAASMERGRNLTMSVRAQR